MTLSSETGTTVANVDKALADLEAEYLIDLCTIKRQLLDPIREEIKRQNAAARKTYAARRKKLGALRAVLVSEGPNPGATQGE